MSRTYRRKSDKPHNFSGSSNYESAWTYTYINECDYGLPDGWEWKRMWIPIPLEGKELAKKKAWYHSDNFRHAGYRKSWRKASHEFARAKNKQELIRFKQNPEYEVMNHQPECLSWW